MRRAARLGLLTTAGAITAAVLVLLAGPAAGALDMWGNIAPASQLPPGSLPDRFPLSHYGFDHDFQALKVGVFSGVETSGLFPSIAWWLTQFVWQVTLYLAVAVIQLFVFAFSLDLVNGSSATGGAGALAPVADAVRSIYDHVFGGPWLTIGVLLAGMWSMWNALVRRRYSETAGALAVSLLCVVIALAFVTQPERTFGGISRWTNEVSASFLSITTEGSVGGHEQAKGNAADHLFELFVLRPWTVLQFGGTEHCAREDGTEVRVRPLASDPGRDLQLARRLSRGEQVQADGKTCVNASKYTAHFLRFSLSSDERDAEMEALKAGDADKLPDADPAKSDGTYQLSAIDKPASGAFGKDAQYQRLGLVVMILAGELGGFLLLGSIAVSVILAQVLALLLLAFAPVALVVGTFPGRGHQFFADWLTRLLTFLIKKAVYALVLAVLLAVSAALQDATTSLGWLMSWGMQAVFMWAVFLQRKQLVGGITNAITGNPGQREESRLISGAIGGYTFAQLVARKLRSRSGGRARRRPDRRPTDAGPPQPPNPSADRPGPDRPRPGSGPAAGGAGRSDGSPSDHDRPDGDDGGPTDSGLTSDGGPAVEVDRGTPADAELPSAPPEPDPATAAPSPAEEAAATPTPDAPTSPPSSLEGEERPPIGGVDEPPQPPAPRSPEHGAETKNSASPPAAADTPERVAHGTSSPLQAALRHDAARLHRDAVQVHHDASQLRHAEPPTATAATPAPPSPRRPAPTRGGAS